MGLKRFITTRTNLIVRVHFRKTYSQQFYDFARDLASKKSDVDNRAEIYNYYEFGGTYHIKDFEESSKTKMFLYKNSYKGQQMGCKSSFECRGAM